MKKVKRTKAAVRRHIEDVPFYQFRYKSDDLPLDPAKPFIIKKLDRFTKSKDPELRANYNLHTYAGFRPEDEDLLGEVEQIRLPSRLTLLTEKPCLPYSFETQEPFVYPWIENLESENPSEHVVFEVTNQLLKIYKERRRKLFMDNARTRSALFSNELQKLYGGPSETIGAFRSGTAMQVRLPTIRKKKKQEIFKPGDPAKIRTAAELRQELDRMSKVIDKLIEPDLLRKKAMKRAVSMSDTVKNLETKCMCMKDVSGMSTDPSRGEVE
ncbi:uncharacterized protein LOC119648580 [Hermetia illucens]|uniref:uncharacterized protein LOC119648580 n=1 Tax=Hermetia illucens TaxID=343691 RepID=UPI0018CBFB66|nr:uncharacterized protein LOC119648580 [Hermetia illucens]